MALHAWDSPTVRDVGSSPEQGRRPPEWATGRKAPAQRLLPPPPCRPPAPRRAACHRCIIKKKKKKMKERKESFKLNVCNGKSLEQRCRHRSGSDSHAGRGREPLSMPDSSGLFRGKQICSGSPLSSPGGHHCSRPPGPRQAAPPRVDGHHIPRSRAGKAQHRGTRSPSRIFSGTQPRSPSE